MTAEACDMNLGPRQRQKRLRSGYVGLGAAFALAVPLFAFHAPHVWRALLFLPLAVAALGFIQYRAKT